MDLWWAEAEKYGVMPLDDRAQARAFARDPATTSRERFVLLPGAPPADAGHRPEFRDALLHIGAHCKRISGGEEGVLMAYGRRAAGFSLFVQENRLVFDYNLAGRHTIVSSEEELPPGAHELACALEFDGTEARLALLVDGREIAAQPLPQAFPAGFGVMSTQCGLNSPSPVSARYEAPFAFQGVLDRVEVDLGPGGNETTAGLWEAAMRSQ